MQTHCKEIHTCDRWNEYIRKDHYEAHLIVYTEENEVNSNAEGAISNWATGFMDMLPNEGESDDSMEKHTEEQYARSDDEWTDTDIVDDNIDDSVVPQLGQSEQVIDVEVYANEPCRMTKYRKSRSLTDALETIQRLRTENQAEILRKAVNQFNIQDWRHC